jgi:hypothetical protein
MADALSALLGSRGDRISEEELARLSAIVTNARRGRPRGGGGGGGGRS